MIAKSTSEFFRARPPTALALAAGFFFALPAFADRPAETIGVPPGPGNGNAPSWAGKAFRQGVVSVANPYGAEAGAQILEAGGNAIDAAVAIAYALNVVEPQSAGVGGGGFMMIHLAKTGRDVRRSTRARRRRPARRRRCSSACRTRRCREWRSACRAWCAAPRWRSRSTASCRSSDVLQPAIKLADEGFAATPRYSAVSCKSRSQNSPESAAYLLPRTAAAPVVGSLVQNKPLAETFRLIAAHGPDCFYKYMPDKGCDIAKGIVEGQKFNRPQAPERQGRQHDLRRPGELPGRRCARRSRARYRGYLIKASRRRPRAG